MSKNQQKLPSPVTNQENGRDDVFEQEPTATPPARAADQLSPRRPDDAVFSQMSPGQSFSSPPHDTQAFPSQPIDPNGALSDEVRDEIKEGVWGYLFPLDPKYGRCVVLKKRSTCPLPDAVTGIATAKPHTLPLKQEQLYEKTKIQGPASGGYLIGRHPECGE